MREPEFNLLPSAFAESRPPPGQAPANKRNSEPPDVGCYERGACRRKVAHFSAAAAAGNAFGALVGARRLRPRRLSAKA